MNILYRSRFSFGFAIVFVMIASSVHAQTRAIVPSAARQAEQRKVLDETFEISKATTNIKRQDVVKKLMDVVETSAEASDDFYVVLTAVLALTKETGEFTVYQKVAGLLVELFEVDTAKEQARLLDEFLKSSKSASVAKPAIEEAVSQALEAASDEKRSADALAILESAGATAKRLNSPSSVKQVITDARTKVTDRVSMRKAFEAAKASLLINADDPVANKSVARWHVLQSADWQTALPFVMKSGDAKWKAAAELETTLATADAMAQAAVGDAWWDAAQTETGAEKTALLLHAGEWYELAQPNLTSVIKQQLLTKRLGEIAPLRGTAVAKSTSSIKPAPAKSPFADEPPAPKGWVDLLEWSEGVNWSDRGIDWGQNVEGAVGRNGLTFKSNPYMNYPLPGILDGDYELEVEFTRTAGADAVCIIFPIGMHSLQLEFSSMLGEFNGVSGVDATWSGKNETTRRPGTIANDQRHRARIRVRQTEEQAEFRIDYNDQKDYIRWDGLLSRLANYSGTNIWPHSMRRHVWIGAYNSKVTFHKVRVGMTSGTIRRDWITEKDREADLKDGFVRLVGLKPTEATSDFYPAVANQNPTFRERHEKTWPLITRDFRPSADFYAACAPSRLKCPIPPGAKSFSVVAMNHASRSTDFILEVDGQRLHRSGAIETAIIKIDLPPKSTLLELVVDPMGNSTADLSYWCYPRFHSVAANAVLDKQLDGKPGTMKFTVASHSVGYGEFTHNKNPFESLQTATVVHFRDAQPCDEFLFTIAKSSTKYAIPEGMNRFTAIGYNVISFSVKYEVLANGKVIYQSPKAGIVPIDVNLPPKTKVIELRVDSLGDNTYDHSIWCYPRLHRK
ncbi:MAG: NPCBM/NEW2 domain-containing protein [Planctomycetota bacterium]